MEVHDSETSAQKAKSERFGKTAIVLFLLLALFWAVGAFVVWILLGAAAYFSFLYFYYQPRQLKADAWRAPSGSYSVNDPGNIKKKAKLIVQIVIGFFVFLFAFFFIIGIVSQEDTTSQENTLTSEESTSDNAQLLNDNPNNIDALTGVGNQFFDESNYDSALFYYNKVLKIAPANNAALYNKGLVYYNLKQYQQSIDLLKNCLNADPANRDAKYIMGHNYYDRQLYDEALNWYQQAYDDGLRDAFLSHALGFLYDNKGNNTKSISFYKEALQLDSSRTTIYTRLAEMEPDNAAWYRKKESEWKK